MNIASIEAGGTKFVVGIVTDLGVILDRVSIDTTTPEETLKLVINYLKEKEFSCIGLGSFGPIEPNKKAKQYGYITNTPKKGWKNFDIVGTLKEAFDCPIGFDTDVNGAALGELLHGAAKGLDSCLYITVGTGIGAGAVVNGKMINGLSHPEMGHILVRRHQEDKYHGCCPFHGDCLEGLASGTAIEQRWNDKAINLCDKEIVWEIEAYYLAQAIMNYVLILSPEKIIIGGGVMHQKQLFPLIRSEFKKLLNDYITNENLFVDEFIQSPELGDNAGLVGCAMIGLNEMN